MSTCLQHPPIGKRFTSEFRDLDPRRLPSAPPRPGQAPAATPAVAEHRVTQPVAIPNAETHAARLRAIAEMPIIDTSVARWLEELATLIEGAAA